MRSSNFTPGYKLRRTDLDRTYPEVEGHGEGRQQKVKTSDRPRRTTRNDGRQRIGGKVNTSRLKMLGYKFDINFINLY